MSTVLYVCNQCDHRWTRRDTGYLPAELRCRECRGWGYQHSDDDEDFEEESDSYYHNTDSDDSNSDSGDGSEEDEEEEEEEVEARVEFSCDCGNTWTRVLTTDLPFELRCRRCRGTGYRPGIATYRCDCGKKFTGVGRLDVRSPCYRCGEEPLPDAIREFDRPIERRSGNTHNCALCRGCGTCPLMGTTAHRRR